MSNNLLVTVKKVYNENVVVSARLPVEIVDSLDDITKRTGRSRNELILMCLEYALKNIEITE